MKKLLSILLAGFIGFLGIFTITSTTKISAEPQYFLQNEKQNAVVKTETNEYIFYLDSKINLYNNYDSPILAQPRNYSKLYYVLEGNTEFIEFDLISFVVGYYSAFPPDLQFKFSSTDTNNQFYLHSESYEDSIALIDKSINDNKWILNINNLDSIIAFKFYDTNIATNVDNLNNYLTNYIGNLTIIDTQTTSIEQIGNIINDTTNWFVNILIGISDIFYSNGTLGIWGSVLFLGVTFTIITMCLKWVISLIRGI